MAEDVKIDAWTADVLGLTSLDRTSVARRLAEIANLQAPSRQESEEYLVEVLLNALSQIPRVPAAWSWGGFYNHGIQSMYDIGREEDWVRLAICAVDLGVADHTPTLYGGEDGLTPLGGLSRNLTDATDRLIAGLRELLEAAGLGVYGHQGFPPPS